MNWFDSLISWLFPRLLLEGSSWEHEWEIRERESFLNSAKISFAILAIAYIGHYLFYDLPLNLQPTLGWLIFRSSVALACLALLLLYSVSISNRMRWYRVPAILVFFGINISQGIVAVVHGNEAWLFAFMLVIVTSIMLRMNAVKSLVFAGINLSCLAPLLMMAEISVANIASGSIVALGMVAVVRSAYVAEIKNFLLNKRNIEAQEKISELNIDFAGQIKSFIPKVIARRIENAMEIKGVSVLQASIEVLEARTTQVACLFSDIRGFTQNSKSLEKFINKSVLPEVKICSDAVEKFDGIPRKIGDLIFAYFDDENYRLNLIRAIAAGMEISRHNEDLNATAIEIDIRRYILISCGEAIVGNLGGVESAIEITALGSPVNFLSRLDDVTKNPALADKLDPGDLLLSKESAELLVETGIDISMTEISLKELDVHIRDFPEVERIFVLKPTEKNLNAILEPYEYVTNNQHVEWGRAN